MGKRGLDDQLWNEVKKIVMFRDKTDRLTKCLTLTESVLAAHQLQNKHLDPAHVLSVGHYPEYCYTTKNVVCLYRSFHELLDNHKSPVTGKSISNNETYYWWWRILTFFTKQYDEKVDYKPKVVNIIKEGGD